MKRLALRLFLFFLCGVSVVSDRMLWLVLRLTLSGLIAAHGWARLFHGGIDPFGAWLQSQGIPFGWGIAWAISILEMVGSIAFAAGIFTLPLALLFSAIYVTGIIMVHAPAGWFVVGLGRNGMEFSVLLIVALLCTGIASRRRTSSRRL